MPLEKLFEPVRIGALEIRNRIVMPPMGTGFADAEGYVTDQLIEYYAERARGGVGLIIFEGTVVTPEGKLVMQPCIYDDRYVPGLARLAQAMKRHGASCAVQLIHSGRRVSFKKTGHHPVAPSPISAYGNGEIPHALTVDEIDRLVDVFASAAGRVKKAGFDAVEVHGGNAHLIAQFLSPMTNKRRDKYGGDLESRARFAVEICHRIRKEVGTGYPFLFRLTVDEFIKGGLTSKDGQRIARLLVDAGVDAIDTTTAYLASSEEGYISQLVPVSGAPSSFSRGCFIHLAHAIKQAVSVPVIGVGRISDPRLADRFIREGKADLTAMGRSLIADPWLPKKALEGRYDDIRTCIACDTCYTHVLTNRSGLSCTVNPELGTEGIPLEPASKQKRVVIVGGGPGGMQAAVTAASRGHEVVLIEKKNHLGGNLVAASAASFKRETDELRRYLIVQVEKSPAEVKLGFQATVEKVTKLEPQAVILANGARPILPDIPGIRSRIVTSAVEVLSGVRELGQVVVVVGGGMVGCETAAFLAAKGKQVKLVTRRSSDFGPAEGLAADMEAYSRRWLLFELWPTLDIEIVAKSTCEEVTDKGLMVKNSEGKRRLIEGDSVVFAMGFTPECQLKQALEGKVPELLSVGDCVEPRQIIHAIREGWEAARNL